MSGNEGTIALVTTKPDTELASELRAKFEQAAKPLIECLNEARAAGFQGALNFTTNPLGVFNAVQVQLTKHY